MESLKEVVQCKPIVRVKTLAKKSLSETQIHQFVERSIGNQTPWQLISYRVEPAVKGTAGFLGDHFRMKIDVKIGDAARTLHLFIKSFPLGNKPKADLVSKQKFFTREVLMYKLFEKMPDSDDANPWRVKSLFYNDSMIVMPDLAHEGYTMRNQKDPLDMPHLLVTTASLARFHAAYANYETRRSVNEPYNILQEHGEVMAEVTFLESPWLRAAAKLTADLLNAFSSKHNNIPQLESKIFELYVRASDTFTLYHDTLNVVVHKDLWVNNILFRYEEDRPVNAVLLDFQCVSYTPPAFDVMQLLYFTTSRAFRELHEETVLRNYYSSFVEKLDTSTERRVKELKYDWENFLEWCERARMFGMMVAQCIMPYALLDPQARKRIFDDPITFDHFSFVDRSAPVLAYARTCRESLERQLELAEEFVERYVSV